jgi:Putative zinc-binding metallo-peptidase
MSAVAGYCKILAQEFLLYPRDFIRRSNLKRIVLCSSLYFGGQKRSAVPDFEHDTLYLDVVAGDYDPDYQSRAIHHELFHIIDYQDDGQLYTDEQWSKLNPSAFRYGAGGAQMQDDPRNGVQWEQPGFMNKYATSGVEEDKAEIFAHMMADYASLEHRAVADELIRKKIAAMKALLTRFSPDMNDDFWSGIRLRRSADSPIKKAR